MVRTTCSIDTYNDPAKGSVKIMTEDLSFSKMVIISIDGEDRTVDGYELINAIKNCLNK